MSVVLKKKEISQNKIASSESTTRTNDYYHTNELLYFEHIPINVKNVLDSQLTLYRNEYYSLPQQLKNSISQITITADDLNSVCNISSNYKVKGCARSEYNDLLLDESYRYGDLLHESIHLYSYQNDRVFSETFYAIYLEEGEHIAVQNGNTHNVYEYYVSAYLLYLNNPDELARRAYKTLRYFMST
ncbi:MAG: hypothetical protein PHQ89_04155 [Bacilli bacterium]|nr:hypothetical protein [Bacilli bacterium]